jgi:hypothetical protein
MNLETIVLISLVVVIIFFAALAMYRKQHEPYGRYEKLKDFEMDSLKNLLHLPALGPTLHQNPPPSQPFIPSPQKKHPIPYEPYSSLDSSYDLQSNIANTSFQRMNSAYKPQMMNLPPVLRRPRMLPPDQQPVDPYSGYPASAYTSDENFNKFYHKFVPDYLWCKDGVCG